LFPTLAVAETFTVRDGVNAIIGDDSYLARFGDLPGPDVDEQVRLRVHLEHVEAVLRAVDTSHLAPELRAARARNLDLLHAYHRRGVFPTNGTYAGRRPHFIDEADRICAVGYLIEQTAGRAAAEAINARAEWAYLWDIHGAEVERWIAQSGLTVRELAMIQPAYDHMRPDPLEPRRPPPVEDEPVEQIRMAVIARINRATSGIQACANAIGLRTTSTMRVSVDVSPRGFLIPGITITDGDALAICAARVTAKQLGRYVTHRRIKATRVIHQLQIFKAPGTPLDREAIAGKLAAALQETCKAAVRARFTLDPNGEIELDQVDGVADRDHTSCARTAIEQVRPAFFGFRGKRTTLDVQSPVR
jgi:hypothetical protein